MKVVDINGKARDCEGAVQDRNFPGYMKVTYSSKTRKGYTHDEWYPLAQFVKNNPQFKHSLASSQKTTGETSGIVSGSAVNSITDKSKKWKINDYAGYPVWISRGKGEGQIRTVVSNSANNLVIDKKWNELPDKTSQYVLSFNVNSENVSQTKGNILPWSGQEEPAKKKGRKKK